MGPEPTRPASPTTSTPSSALSVSTRPASGPAVLPRAARAERHALETSCRCRSWTSSGGACVSRGHWASRSGSSTAPWSGCSSATAGAWPRSAPTSSTWTARSSAVGCGPTTSSSSFCGSTVVRACTAHPSTAATATASGGRTSAWRATCSRWGYTDAEVSEP